METVTLLVTDNLHICVDVRKSTAEEYYQLKGGCPQVRGDALGVGVQFFNQDGYLGLVEDDVTVGVDEPEALAVI